tara:strand:+ start:3157 stop:3444 length:288 start_codon:yes stop_codon:yes gene_type:complete
MFNQVELMEIQEYIIAEEEVNTSDEDGTEYLKVFITEGVERFLNSDTEAIREMIIKNIRKKKPLFKITDEEEIKTIKERIKKRNKEYVESKKNKV